MLSEKEMEVWDGREFPYWRDWNVVKPIQMEFGEMVNLSKVIDFAISSMGRMIQFYQMWRVEQ